MALDFEAIQERKVALQGDIKELRETISQLDTKRQELVGNLNALSGADQQCDLYLALLEEKDKEEPKTKKKNENI